MSEWRRRSSSSLRREAARKVAAATAAAEGDTLTLEEAAAIEAVGGPAAATYGEITPRGFAALATRMQLGPASAFADLGSGTGKVVLQAIRSNDVARAYGVELARSRHASALAAARRCPAAVASRATFVLGDVADSGLWAPGGALAEVTDVYCSSLLFGPVLMGKLAALLDSSRVEQVATLRRFSPGELAGFAEDARPEPCEMSWTMNEAAGVGAASGPLQSVYLYRRSRRRSAPQMCAAAEETYATTASGLRWVDETVGAAEVAEPGCVVRVRYSGTLLSGAGRSVGNGQVATWEVDQKRSTFALGGGRGGIWDECVVGMRVGGTRRVLVPPSARLRPLKKGRDTIPPGETAKFVCELVAIERGVTAVGVRAGLAGEGSVFPPLLFLALFNAALWGVYYPWLLTQPIGDGSVGGWWTGIVAGRDVWTRG